MGEPLSVLVAGAGIGGLTAAIGLRRIGARVRVFERRAEPGAIGAGIAVFRNALRCFDELGVGAAVRAVTARPLGDGVAEAGGGLRLPSGRWLMRMTDAADPDLLTCHRNDLQVVLLRQLPPGAVEASCEVVAVAGVPAGVEVTVRRDGTETTETVRADLLIAADGVGSRVRATLWPEAGSPRYAGYTAWRAVTARGGVPSGAGETWGRGRRFGIVPIADGRVYWFATENRPPGSAVGLTGRERYAEVVSRFGRWHDPIPRLLASTAPDDVLQHDIARLDPPLTSFVHGRVALVGDAAHAMTPDLGQGACQAVEDATVLAAALATSPGVEAALAAYDADRRPRTQRIARTAHRIGQVAQLEHPLATATRTAAMRLLPASALRSGGGWLLDWQPPRVPAVGEVPQSGPAG